MPKIVAVIGLLLIAGGVRGNDNPGFRIELSKPVAVTVGAYGRVHSIGDGKYAFVYERNGAVCFRTSENAGRSWGKEVVMAKSFVHGEGARNTRVYPANPEIAAISGGRLICAFNWRPIRNRTNILHPYAIALTISDDGGATWQKPKTLYEATNTTDGVSRGCYEPFVQEIAGKVRIYFSDESPYVDGKRKFQNISYLESADQGETWNKPVVYCYKPKARDGMPVALVLNGCNYVAIESNGRGTHLHPEIVREDGARFEPLQKARDWRKVYAGAPYLIATENFLVLSYQTSTGIAVSPERVAVCEVVAMPKDEIKLCAFRGAVQPLTGGTHTGATLWNSLCALGGDEFLIVSQQRGRIYHTRAKVIKTPQRHR